MCGIVGYIGKNNNPQIGLNVLKRLEYRGYDSWGASVFNSEKKEIFCFKRVGKISDSEKEFKQANLIGNPFLFHNRWATHGGVTEINAHPHFDCQKNIYLVHNGIIENYKELKEQLIKEGHKFISETDTEVLPHLIEKYFKGNLEKAVKRALADVRGAYAIAVISRDDPHKIVVARLGSPLLIGLGENEYLVASDSSAVITRTRKVINLYDNEVVVLTAEGGLSPLLRRRVDSPILSRIEKIEWTIEEAEKKGFPHFMLKEIMEQPESIHNSLRGRLILDEGKAKLGGLELVQEKLREINKINIIACGTSYYAGLIGGYMVEEYTGIPCRVDLASEFRYRKSILDKKTLVLAVSQSGETADTLGAIKEAKEKGALVLGIVNVVGSSISRETEAGIYNHAGPEIGVASTKAFTSQVAVLTLLTLFLGRQRQLSLVMGQRIVNELLKIPELVKKVLENNSQAKELAEKYKNFNNFLYLGRKYNYPVALEGALKLKEISYIHAEGYSAGEMKHGPLSLIDENFPTLAICPSDTRAFAEQKRSVEKSFNSLSSVYEKMISNIEEIKARKGLIIVIATEGNKGIKEIVDDVIYIPKTLEMLTPIISVIPLQLFAYYVSVFKGYDPDFPRNLAKSVTVE